MKKYYMVLTADSQEQMMTLVTKHLSRGWECQGGVSVVSAVVGMNNHYGEVYSKTRFYQAVVIDADTLLDEELSYYQNLEEFIS